MDKQDCKRIRSAQELAERPHLNSYVLIPKVGLVLTHRHREAKCSSEENLRLTKLTVSGTLETRQCGKRQSLPWGATNHCGYWGNRAGFESATAWEMPTTNPSLHAGHLPLKRAEFSEPTVVPLVGCDHSDAQASRAHRDQCVIGQPSLSDFLVAILGP